MAAGSAFDAYVKHHLAADLYGANIPAHLVWPKVFESQVEQQNRAWGIDNGRIIYEAYVACGAYKDLLRELEQSLTDPMMEFEATGNIGGVEFLGKPDLGYTHKEGTKVIHDFKVNGYCSKYGQSPKAGYLMLLPDNKQHKDALPVKYRGVTINGACFLESVDAKWAEQLATYSWLLGSEIGSEDVIAIDQICCKMGTIKVAKHRSRVSRGRQTNLLERYQKLWELVNSDYFFRTLSKEDSQKKCQMLQQRAQTLRDDPQFANLL